MRGYPTEVCETHYYYKDGQLYNTYEPESIFLLAPGDVAWKSDLDILRQQTQGKPSDGKLSKVVAKYLINRNIQDQ